MLFLVLLLLLQTISYCMKLKYQPEIEKLSHCFIGFEELDLKPVFRWVFEDINLPKNFQPPNRLVTKHLDDFKGWALSFHKTYGQSEGALRALCEDKPKLFLKLGTHIAEGLLNKSDGLSEINADEKGHFNHFEYVGISLSKKFTILKKIAP